MSKLRKSSSSGHRHATAGSWGNGDGQLRHPWGAAVASKRVYVTDQGNNRISVFDTDKLKWLFSFGSDGAKQGQFREPRGLAVHGTELFVADYRNHRIQVFSTADADKAKCPVVRILGGGPSSTVGRFNGPSGGAHAPCLHRVVCAAYVLPAACAMLCSETLSTLKSLPLSPLAASSLPPPYPRSLHPQREALCD